MATSRVVVLGVMFLLLCACASSRPPMSAAEAGQLERLGRDRGVRIGTVLRRDDGTLEVWTRQGSQQRRYLIVSEDEDDARILPQAEGFRVR